MRQIRYVARCYYQLAVHLSARWLLPIFAIIRVHPSSGSFAVSDEYGTVQPAGPFTINPDGTYSFTVNLQASRIGSDKDGRQYTISVFAKDNAGNPGSSSIVISVPHDRGH